MTIDRYREKFATILQNTISGLHIAFELSASAGYCIIEPDSGGTIEDYIQIADESMYEEKEKSRLR